MRVTRPPWQGGGRRGRRKQQDDDDLWLLEKALLGPAAESSPQPQPQSAAAAAEEIEGEDDFVVDTGGEEALGPPSSHHHHHHQEQRAVEVLVVEGPEVGQRVDRFLAAKLKGQSRSACGELCDAGLVLVGGSRARKSAKLSEGEVVEVLAVRTTAPVELVAEPIPLDVLYEDAHVIAINKPPGMVVHPAPGNRNGTFVNALLHHTRGQIEAGAGTEGRPGIVHRLDKGTSGVLIAAKTASAHAALSAAFAERRVTKTYLAVCIGSPGEEAVIDAPIGRHPKDRQRMAVAMTTGDFAAPSLQQRIAALEQQDDDEDADGEAAAAGGDDDAAAYEGELLMGRGGRTGATPLVGRAARSTVRTLAFDGRLGVVEVGIETGRTHQIRVHLQHRRHPVLGDELYGNAQWNGRARRRWGVERPMLHALRLELAHPVTGEMLRLVAPVPPDMLTVVEGVWPQLGAHQGVDAEVNTAEWWAGVLAARTEAGGGDGAEEEEEEPLSKEEEAAERRRQMEEAGLDDFGWPLEE
jgi:23S rRNA pseudouridine1911/1915/1917 synthase